MSKTIREQVDALYDVMNEADEAIEKLQRSCLHEDAEEWCDSVVCPECGSIKLKETKEDE